jgi:leader peptidase (prepilin peptidase)/N-methyltransferase
MNELIEALRASPALLISCVTLLGLMVGSFLNVVILRLPKMMEADWKRECRLVLDLSPVEEPKVTLWSPPSCCPSCQAPIRPWQNIPVISWLLLRGRCAGCGTAISIQYPLVELVAGILSGVCVWRFGWSPQLAAALVLTWTLIALTVIDLREFLLPDSMTLPLIWIGLALSTAQVFAGKPESIWGAIAGYLSLWSIYWLFKLLTGKEGMGAGDFKLLAGLGAWFGAGSLLAIVLLSSVVGSVVGISLMAARKAAWSSKIPFGPYIAGAGWIYLIWGSSLQQWIGSGLH